MASRTIYPPIVNSFEPAFVAGSGSQLRVYFSFSALSTIPNLAGVTIHANIMRKDGVSVLNTTNDYVNGRYRAAGIILNLVPQRDSTLDGNYYYVVINNEDLKSIVTLSGRTYNGWIPGWTYKIQLRISTVTYPGGNVKQAAWLQEYANYFSEWSSICYTKAISEMALQIPLFEYDSANNVGVYDPDTVHLLPAIDFSGSLSSSIVEADENYNYINVALYKNGIKIEDSGEIYKTELSNSYFSYIFKTKFINKTSYELRFTYETENGYKPASPLIFLFQLVEESLDILDARLVTIDNDYNEILTDVTTLDMEEDEGRLGIKIVSDSHSPYSGNICVRRSSAKDNFAYWEDVKIFILKEQDINSIPIFYDYTIESGMFYKYGIQSISERGERGLLIEISNPIQRVFNYSYLLGKNGQQLKLQFNNTVGNFKPRVGESKTETIGSKYPFINRNGNLNYKDFSISGLISFWMDECNTFLQNGKKDIYQYDSVVREYERYNEKNNILQYDYTFERDFREKVYEFLIDGQPKLFKSPTEGNIIVRLLDVGFNPIQSVGRLIYDFSCSASEIDEANMPNYQKYGFYDPGIYGSDFSIVLTCLGQIDGTFKNTDNIFKLIYEKYDSQGQNYGGYSKILERIHRVKITISDPPLRVQNNANEIVLGNNFRLSTGSNNSIITIYDPRGIYEFDSLLDFYYRGDNFIGNDGLYLLGDAEGQVEYVNATIDFLYDLKTVPYVAAEIKEKKTGFGIGQFFEEVTPGTNIYNVIYYRYYINSNSKFRFLTSLSSIEIEANPHTVFGIQDRADSQMQYHEIGDSGVLTLSNLNNIVSLKYIGKRYKTNNEISDEIITNDIIIKDVYNNDTTVRAAADVSITYEYSLTEGFYKEE